MFEVDSRAGELRKRGAKLKIQDQPLRILILLLESAGQIVTREQLRTALWSDDTFVDFEHSLNAAVAKLRQTLGDTAENPRFVETVARRGYRFIAPVEVIGSPAAPDPPTGTAAAPHRRMKLAVAAAALALLAALIAATRPRPERGDGHRALTRLTADAGLTTDPTVSSDGKLLAYASDRSSEYLKIWLQRPVPGGEVIQLTDGQYDDHQCVFSPDGTKLAFRSERDGGGIYVVHTLGGARPLLVAQSGKNPQFSPDGKWIAYWTGGTAIRGGKVWTVPSTGGPPQLVSAGLASAGTPVWSPDGNYLLMAGQRTIGAHYDDTPDWWVVARSGGTPVRTGAFETFRRAGMRIGNDTIQPTGWTAARILFSAGSAGAVDAWLAAISPGTWRIDSPPQRLTSITGIATSASAMPDGRVVFASVSNRIHLWALPIDANRGLVAGKPRQLTDSDAAEYWPSASADGTLLAFTSTRSGKQDIWLKDLVTGKESALPLERRGEFEFPKVSPDGKQIAYTAIEQQRHPVYVWAGASKLPERVLDDGDWIWTWTPDARYLLLKWGPARRVRLFDLSSRRLTEFLEEPGGDVYQPAFSPDGRWIAFMNNSGLLVAPYLGPAPIPKREWIVLTSDGKSDDKPRWSPDGNRIYFTSDRDGFRCLWTLRLDPLTKRPIGKPESLYHFHRVRHSIVNVGHALSDIAIAHGMLVFPLDDGGGNIWITSPQPR